LDINQAEGLGALAGASVFPWAEEKVEGDSNHVHHGGLDRIWAGLCNKGNIMKEDSYKDGFDAMWVGDHACHSWKADGNGQSLPCCVH